MKFVIVFSSSFSYRIKLIYIYDEHFDDEHFDCFDDLNDDDDDDDEIPLHPYIDTPCRLPTWTAPPYNWKR